MNISKIELPWFQDQDLAAFMEETYGIDIDEVICKAILEVEDEENGSNNGAQQKEHNA